MCVKFSLGDLNSSPYSPYPTNTYTCGVTIIPKVCGGFTILISYDFTIVKESTKSNSGALKFEK